MKYFREIAGSILLLSVLVSLFILYIKSPTKHDDEIWDQESKPKREPKEVYHEKVQHRSRNK